MHVLFSARGYSVPVGSLVYTTVNILKIRNSNSRKLSTVCLERFYNFESLGDSNIQMDL